MSAASSPFGRPTRRTEEFRAARDLLLSTRLDHDGACRAFRWPRFSSFNWALEWFDVVAEGSERTALELVAPDGTVSAISYQEMAHRSAAVASWLAGRGVRRGDRVLVVLGTQQELWESLLACLKLGAVVIPSYTDLTPAEARDRTQRGGVRHVVCRSDLVALFRDAPGGVRVAVGAGMPGWADYGEAFRPARPFVPDGPTPAQDLAFCYFTSGTTSLPKLVGHTHASYPVGHLSSMYWNGVLPGDRHLTVSAPGWAKHSWSGFFVPWNAEATVVACADGCSPDRLTSLLAERRVTSFCAPPSTWYALRPFLRAARPALREATSAGEPLDPCLAREVYDAWGLRVRDGYGQTETTALIGTTPGLTPRPGWLGKVLPGYDVLVDGRADGPAEGEVHVDLAREPLGVMLGYLDDPSRTGAVLTSGRYRTGDVGVRDESGWVRLVGRRDDVFKSFGHRISPYELEAVLRAHPEVLEAAVVAVPHALGGAVPHAVVVPSANAQEADLPSRLLVHVDERVAPSLRLHAVHVADRLPRTASGKIRRSAVGEWVRATAGGATGHRSLGVSDPC
ncbi:acetyl-CoA synthetase [Geodermatophilus africanus]|uniref:Acetyl-CoA synthetase n=1 Tax=Geodermatophilus africanus TaxID=1137993 RepID=A0A1H3AKZ6_9ACTN|nr:AMP-binding protein [Geodermatophilus africanus]SDX29844.1 acetyl-CoA synthetase [Geodermatophilus africanus]